jgi:hypothetical protein
VTDADYETILVLLEKLGMECKGKTVAYI